MDPESVAAVLRPRRHWESIDLGFTMARTWWRPLWGAWILTVLPLQALVWLVLASEPLAAIAVLWWLKALFDRVPLFVLSRALFGATPSPTDVVRALPTLARLHPTALLWGRLEPSRSLHLPVWQLEGLTGAERARRGRVLARTVETPASWLTVGCLGLATSFFIGALALGWLLAPEAAGLSPELLLERALDGGEPNGAIAWVAACHLFAVGVVEPLYVAGGFGLYINRRTHLEGWDIEVAFRRLARRLTSRERPSRTLGPLTALLCLALGSGSVQAQPVQEGADPATTIEQVLAHEDFGPEQTRTRWSWPWLEDFFSASDDDWSPSCGDGLNGGGLAGPGLAGLLELALWALAGIGVAVLVVWLGRRLQDPAWRRASAESTALPDLIRGHDALPDVLPSDVPRAALALWESGEHAAALGMLYAGALLDLVTHRGLDIPRAATEGDCVDAVRRAPGGPLAAYFSELTRAWLQTAYAHRRPAGDQVRALIATWSQHFQGVAP